MQVQEVYISLDVETLGGNPYENPMINLGAVAFASDRQELGRISLNLSMPEGYRADANTLEWFQTKNADVYAKITCDPLPPLEAMKQFRAWCYQMSVHGNCVFVCYPTIYDGTWLYDYWFKYLGHPAGGKGPGFSVIDIRSYAMGRLGLATYAESRKDKALAPFCPADAPHTHEGVDDAYEQGIIFFNLRDYKLKASI